ncbi:chromosome partition protein Smc [Telopea speciosissima]|uniref:chromosome partition protein Smc n=1 Tax=Telopea speciosissima TaxID=54955 RepID=UPI001CC7D2EC|nr:chromosome partition protein Smc [Telopea speciosissima]
MLASFTASQGGCSSIMGGDKGSKVSSDRKKWQKIFNALVHMMQTQQIQLESLAKERKLLQDRIQIQQDRWVSDVHVLQQEISQMKMDILQVELARSLEEAKSDLVVGLKQREAFLYKLKLGSAETDLEDLKLWVECLTHKCSEQKGESQEKIKEIDKGKGGGEDDRCTKEEEQRRSKLLEGEVRKLKRAQEKLNSENNSEVSALLTERNFLWNQFKKMESDYDSLLKSKLSEIQLANEKIEKLIASMEQLESSNGEKDETILMLRTDLAKLEAAMDHSNTEFSRLSKELESLRNSRSASVTPVLNRCTVDPSSSILQSKNTSKDRRLPVKKEFAGPSTSDLRKESEKGCRKSSKRKGVEAVPTSETPRLFSSTFKVPKLKNPSSIPCVT